MPLTDKDILQILALVEGSSFDLLQLEYGDLKLTVSKSGRLPAEAMAKRDASASEERTSAPAPPVPSASATSAAPEHPARPASAPALVPVKAPVVGTFYAAPEPGASPFVSLGAAVEEDTTVGLIEVMKVYNGVSAGVNGKIVEILVEDAQFVEYGQPLFLVQPHGGAGD